MENQENAGGKPVRSNKNRADRELSFTRRALLEMGWRLPVIVAATIPAAFAAHGDKHEDETHGDNRHLDVRHGDEKFIDVPHEDTAHMDTRHADVRHADGPVSLHSDFSDNGRHGDLHIDRHADTAHSDTPHADARHMDVNHNDRPHTDIAHNDQAHIDRPHFDSHVDNPN
jgi:hypothetical protein